MEKLIEVIAISNFRTMVVMTSQAEKSKDLEIEIGYAMRRIKQLNTANEKFEIESVKVLNTLKEVKI